MDAEQYPLVGECSERYEVTPLEDGGVRIEILVSRRFADLWLFKLEELTATLREIREFEPDVPAE